MTMKLNDINPEILSMICKLSVSHENVSRRMPAEAAKALEGLPMLASFSLGNCLRWRFYFRNGYGASIRKGNGSIGLENNNWELAVLSNRNGGWEPCYTTPLTNDVIGDLSDVLVLAMCQLIANLPEEAT